MAELLQPVTAHPPSNVDSEGHGYSYTESEYSDTETDSIFAEFLERYSVNYSPEYVVKLRKSVNKVTLGANLTVAQLSKDGIQEWSLVAKPAGKDSRWLRKVVASPEAGVARLYTTKWRLGELLRLQLIASASRARGLQLNWKATTKWSTNNKVGRKEKYPLTKFVEFRPHWKVDLYMPEVTGSLGRGDGEVQLEKGHCHLSFPKMVFVCDLDGRRKPSAAAAVPVAAVQSSEEPQGSAGLLLAYSDGEEDKTEL